VLAPTVAAYSRVFEIPFTDNDTPTVSDRCTADVGLTQSRNKNESCG